MPGSNASRRAFLRTAGLATGLELALRLRPRPAHAAPPALEEAIGRVVGRAPVRVGRVTLEVPPLVENGNTVPLTVGVDAGGMPVRAIHVFTEKNPQPNVATFRFGPRAGRPRVGTRIRLATTQTVVAVAELGDGSFWSGSADVVVTLAACLEEV